MIHPDCHGRELQVATTLFDTIEQVQDKDARWLWTYNHERPNMALGGITPAITLATVA